jgi:putative MATE family efflux protein
MLDSSLPWLLIRLALPNLAPFAGIVILVSVDAIVVGRLGRDALAGLSLVFPLVMLSQTMAAGGLGSAVASAIARSLGSGDERRARSLALHGLLIALAISLCFAVLMFIGAKPLFRAMGARDAVLSNAVVYATVVFLGASAPWFLNVAASIARGTGNMTLPALAIATSAVSYIALAPALTSGVGSFGGHGIVGTAVAFVASYSFGLIVVVVPLFSVRGPLPLRFREFALDWSALREILTVGALGGTNAVLSSLTAVIATGFVAQFGPVSLAGYGLGARLEYVVVPLSFAFGTALVTVVGANIGAGNFERAKKAAWIGAALTASVTTGVGAVAWRVPHAWLRLFTTDGEVQEAGVVYLSNVAPYYGFFGLGLALYFAAIGAGRPGLPVAATMLRLTIVSVGMYWMTDSLPQACAVLAISFAAYGLTIAAGTSCVSWATRKH